MVNKPAAAVQVAVLVDTVFLRKKDVSMKLIPREPPAGSLLRSTGVLGSGRVFPLQNYRSSLCRLILRSGLGGCEMTRLSNVVCEDSSAGRRQQVRVRWFSETINIILV